MDNTFLEHFVLIDALASPFNGLSGGHIRSNFKEIDGFIDIRGALKDHPEIWKKSALYTNYTQCAVLFSYWAKKGSGARGELYRLITTAATTSDGWSDIFRYCDPLSANFLAHLSVEDPLIDRRPSGSPLIFSTLFSLFSSRKEVSAEKIVAFAAHYTTNCDTLVGALLCERLVRQCRARLPQSFVATLSQIIAKINGELADLLPKIFTLGINPDDFEKSLQAYSNVVTLVSAEQAAEQEKVIASFLSTRTGNNITRATVDHPIALLPYVVAKIDQWGTPAFIYKKLIHAGGEVQLATLLTTMLISGVDELHDEFSSLADTLVNKGKMKTVLKQCASGKISEVALLEFLAGEKLLTAKASEEHAALCRHAKKKGKRSKGTKQPRHKSRNEQLAQPIIESWTKEDQARYRKEKQRNIIEEDDVYSDDEE